jgi:hypothetical protein
MILIADSTELSHMARYSAEALPRSTGTIQLNGPHGIEAAVHRASATSTGTAANSTTAHDSRAAESTHGRASHGSTTKSALHPANHSATAETTASSKATTSSHAVVAALKSAAVNRSEHYGVTRGAELCVAVASRHAPRLHLIRLKGIDTLPEHLVLLSEVYLRSNQSKVVLSDSTTFTQQIDVRTERWRIHRSVHSPHLR